MSYVDHIINVFGGVRSLSRTIGRSPSTVHGWKCRGTIPDEYKVQILAASEREGRGLTKADFFPSSLQSEDAA